MESGIQKKYGILKSNLKKYGRVIIAFSGGVDSTFLLQTACDVLGKENVISVTVDSCFFPNKEMSFVLQYIKENGMDHIISEIDILSIKEIRENTPERCYTCKKTIFRQISEIASKKGIFYVLEGSNSDDDKDYRPGTRAVKELGILSPLKEAGLTKDEIRILSKGLSLLTWEKPAMACLASRVPYGTAITKENLGMIEAAENYLAEMGFSQFRVRYHGDLAKIELLEKEMNRIFDDDKIRKNICEKFKETGFKYTALDLLGYRTGSLNEVLPKETLLQND